MQVKFNKGSKEWQMFVDFWNMCQKYWEIEDNDNYWQGLVDDAECFTEKYKEIDLSVKLAMAFIETCEAKNKR